MQSVVSHGKHPLSLSFNLTQYLCSVQDHRKLLRFQELSTYGIPQEVIYVPLQTLKPDIAVGRGEGSAGSPKEPSYPCCCSCCASGTTGSWGPHLLARGLEALAIAGSSRAGLHSHREEPLVRNSIWSTLKLFLIRSECFEVRYDVQCLFFFFSCVLLWDTCCDVVFRSVTCVHSSWVVLLWDTLYDAAFFEVVHVFNVLIFLRICVVLRYSMCSGV